MMDILIYIGIVIGIILFVYILLLILFRCNEAKWVYQYPASRKNGNADTRPSKFFATNGEEDYTAEEIEVKTFDDVILRGVYLKQKSNESKY